MKKLSLLIIVMLGACNFTFAQMPFGLDKVREIKLLESSRDDIRKIFGDFKSEKNEDQYHEDSYDVGDAQVHISYAEAKCSNDEESDDWNIAEWKVTNIAIYPKSSTKFSDVKPILSNLGTKLSKFKREKSYDNIGFIFLYHNKELGIAIEVEKGKITEIGFSPAKKYYSSLCNQQVAKTLANTKSWFIKPLKERFITTCPPNLPADTESLILSLPEITASCSLSDSSQSKSCSNGVKAIAVFAVGKDPEGDVLTYLYTVSGGKITGYGQKVLWDLSDVKPGTYTITAAVDDGCGFCGKSMTKTVVVKECSDCGKNF